MTTTGPPGSPPDRSDDRSRVRYAPVNGIDVAYETFGDPARPAILLVMCLGTQMIAWPDDMCSLLADAGHVDRCPELTAWGCWSLLSPQEVAVSLRPSGFRAFGWPPGVAQSRGR